MTTKFIPVAAAAFILAVAMDNAEAHEAVVIDVDNANGVLIEVCNQLTAMSISLGDIDRKQGKAFYDACIEYTAEQMYADSYIHDHS